jgi:hypothetical protein
MPVNLKLRKKLQTDFGYGAFLRLHVGLENINDLKADIKNGLDKLRVKIAATSLKPKSFEKPSSD